MDWRRDPKNRIFVFTIWRGLRTAEFDGGNTARLHRMACRFPSISGLVR